MSGVIKTKHQEVAELSLECVRRIKETNDKNYIKNYSSYIKRLPSTIVNNGLIPALAFYKSKGGERGQIFQDVSEILEKLEFKPYLDWKNNSQNQNKDLLEFLFETDPQKLRLTTNEILNIATWLKRMAEIELKVED
ncbi:type III-B CRISPR module-associated protein Cmr5 [Candidatus Chrysopegis kryptomonas]|uniref:CRISPR type III-B/RAMP module-associated protein Cmr5 n=1 Tax=Candidatus Chryseopegocella kryptomonas TaxID=1633643 RepID=A0A0P1NYN3_9BACT|nr:type III-B CRISPR module-associated protein Cmr5 [Candidatus Chrysopegis kryptomonas]CUT04657.1 CRISPR-associated protein, Cmr5 family [Candidatus Chrysopegis kryptomonas]